MRATSVAPARGQQPEPDPPAPDFGTVYRDQGAHVWRILQRMGVASRHLEDAWQDVFSTVLRLLPTYRPQDRLRAWLAAIASNIASRYRAQERREPMADEDDMPQRDRAPDSENAAGAREHVLLLLDAIKQPERRIVFIMHYLDGHSIAEIAHALQIPEGTAAKRLSLARQAFEAAERRIRAHDRQYVGAVIPLFSALPLLEAERAIPPLPPGVADRVWARLQQTPEWQHAHDARGGDSRGAVSNDGLRSAARSLIAHLLAAGPFVGLFALGIVFGALWDPLHGATPKHVEARPETAVTASPSTAALAPSSAPLAPSSAPSPSLDTRSPARSSLVVSGTARERALVKNAAAALASGDPLVATENARTFDEGGQDAEEREALWIEALLRRAGSCKGPSASASPCQARRPLGNGRPAIRRHSASPQAPQPESL